MINLNEYKIPNTPGVYIFKGARGEKLYIGRATCLQERVRSYGAKSLAESRGPLLLRMLSQARSVDWQETDSVLEAIILEANLIKKYQPPYNTKEKSDKSFNYIVITKEDFPRVLSIRESELLKNKKLNFKIKYLFGPFAQASILKEALKIVRKIFPYRDLCEPFTTDNKNGKKDLPKPCFNKQIGLCPGVCVGEIDKAEYGRVIRNIALIFQGKKRVLLQKLELEMRNQAGVENFERASRLRDKIFALKHINETSLIKKSFRFGAQSNIENRKNTERIEAYDISHISETARVGAMIVIQNGRADKNEYRKFKINTASKGDVAALKEILERRFAHIEWALPDIMVVDGGTAQINVAENILNNLNYNILVVGVTKDIKHKPKQIIYNLNNNEDDYKIKEIVKLNKERILLANAEAHRFALSYHRNRRDKMYKYDKNTK